MIPFRVIRFIGILLFTGSFAFAQNSLLVKFNDLKFNSDFEKEAFMELQSGKSDYLKLFLGISPAMNQELFNQIDLKIKSESDRIRAKKFDKLKDEKKISLIYTIVNDEVLSRYEEKILFPDIFKTGNFNCLTASAYYGFLFTDLNVGFDFRETMNHVHPVAYPSTLQIKVETTDPLNGFQYFDSKLKLQFVGYLINAKIISKEEAKNTTIDSIFNKFYFPESSIGLKELAGLQYLNDALYRFGDGSFDQSFIQIQKAYYLYPSNRVSTLMLFLLSGCISEQDYKEVEDVSYIALASRFIGNNLDEKLLLSEFASLTEEVLVSRSQTVLYDQMFDTLMNSIDEGNTKISIETQYHFQKGRVLMSTFRIKEALAHFEKALSLQPENLELQTLTVQSLAYSFSTASNQEIVKNIEDFELRFPLMQTNEGFISLQMIGYLQLGEEKFDFEKPAEGELLLKKFENLFRLHPGISIQYEKVGDAYSAAAVYYFKRNNKISAKAWLNRGLVISPENYQLMYRLRALD